MGTLNFYLMSSDGTAQRNLTRNRAEDDSFPYSCFDWSPDGRRIAFNSERDGMLEIFVMNADGSHVRKLTDALAGGCPSWPSDGRRIVFDSWIRWPDDLDLYVIGQRRRHWTKKADARVGRVHPSRLVARRQANSIRERAGRQRGDIRDEPGRLGAAEFNSGPCTRFSSGVVI